MVRQLDSESEFFAAIGSSNLTVVKFYATWCGPCRSAAPKYESVSMRFPNCKFYKVDVDINKAATRFADVRAMPTIKLYRNGHEIAFQRGGNMTQLESMITQYMY